MVFRLTTRNDNSADLFTLIDGFLENQFAKIMAAA